VRLLDFIVVLFKMYDYCHIAFEVNDYSMLLW